MLRLHDLPRHGVDIVIILNAARGKFQLEDRGPIVMVEFLIVKYRVRCIDIRLGKRNFLCFFQCDVGGRLAVFGIGGIIVIVINSHDTRRKVQAFHRLLGAGAYIHQKIIAGNH